MTYGLPCPDEPQPAQVFTLAQTGTDALVGVVQAIEAEIAQAVAQADGYTNQVVGQLRTALAKQTTGASKTIGDILDLLRLILSTANVNLGGQIQQTIQDIADQLQTTTQEIVYGGYPQPASPQPFPPATQPGQPVVPGQLPGTFPPGTSPSAPPSYPATAPAPPTVRPVTINGSLVQGTALCAPVAFAESLATGGYLYSPAVQVVQIAGGVTVGSNGGPVVAVGYDPQADGSVVVSIGPVAVILSAPPAPVNPDAPACQLAPV